jgi:hypothetical protein
MFHSTLHYGFPDSSATSRWLFKVERNLPFGEMFGPEINFIRGETQISAKFNETDPIGEEESSKISEYLSDEEAKISLEFSLAWLQDNVFQRINEQSCLFLFMKDRKLCEVTSERVKTVANIEEYQKYQIVAVCYRSMVPKLK